MKASMGAATALIASTCEELGKAKDELAKVEKSKALDEDYSTKAEKSKVLDDDYSTKLKLECETLGVARPPQEDYCSGNGRYW